MPGPSSKLASLSVWLVLAGAAGGIFSGIFFGDYAALLKPVGDIYAMLLEVAVYPYLICSLLHGLGRMTPAEAGKLLRKGWVFYLALWVLIFGILIVLASGIPSAKPLSYVPSAPAAPGPSLLEMLIPSDPFTALSKNYVPAVILFCLFFGVALQHVKEKEALLGVLDSIRLTSLTFWNGVVKFAPLAVFAIFAAEAGTLRIAELESITVFLMLFFIGALGLAFWVLPACVAALTPWKSGEVLREIRSAFMIAIVTTLSVAALPYITAATQKLAERCGIDDPERDEVIRTNISIAYPFGQLGNFFVYLFIIFAASMNGVEIPAFKEWILPLVSLSSCVGSPTSSVDSVTFLSAWLGLPDSTTAFYVGLMALTRYGQVIVSVAGFAFLSFAVTLAYYGKIRVRPISLALVITLAIAIAGAAGLGGRKLSARLQEGKVSPYLSFSLDPSLIGSVKATEDANAKPPAVLEPVMPRIRQTGELRVGYNDSIIPFSFRNSDGQLTGYDIAFAYQLAADLNVNLRLIPFQWQTLASDLEAQKFDIAMSGIYVTDDRLLRLRVSTPYFQSPLAFFLPRERVSAFRSRADINNRPGVRIGVFDDPVLIPRVKRTFPNAEIVVVPNYQTPPDFSKIDAAIWTLMQAEALAAAYPNLAAVQPTDSGDPYLFAYLMPQEGEEFGNFVNYWLAIKRADGFEKEQNAYWIERQPRHDPEPRWSILRDVLGIGK
jgi:Na+/H+-dicarboxylate symporter/ABC-type amino acid transport substrate-binding protein